MTFHATRRGAAIVGLWLVLAGALAVFLFGPGGWVSALLLAAWAAAVYGGFVPRLASAKLYVGGTMFQRAGACFFPLCAGSHAALSQAATFWRRRFAALRACAC